MRAVFLLLLLLAGLALALALSEAGVVRLSCGPCAAVDGWLDRQAARSARIEEMWPGRPMPPHYVRY